MQENTSPIQSIPVQPQPVTPVIAVPPQLIQPQPVPVIPTPVQTVPVAPVQPLPSTPQPVPVAPNPEGSSKKIFLVIALVLVLFFAAIAFVYTKYGKSMMAKDEVVDVEVLPPVGDIDVIVATPIVEATPATENMNLEEWKTHTDLLNRFSFQYPGDLLVDTNGAATVNVGSHQGSMLGNITKWGSTQKADTELYDGFHFTVGKIPLQQKTLEQIANEAIDGQVEGVGGELLKPVTPINIADKQGVTYSFKGLGEFTYILLPNDSETFFYISYTAPDPSNQGYQQTVDQILFTLKFL